MLSSLLTVSPYLALGLVLIAAPFLISWAVAEIARSQAWLDRQYALASPDGTEAWVVQLAPGFQKAQVGDPMSLGQITAKGLAKIASHLGAGVPFKVSNIVKRANPEANVATLYHVIRVPRGWSRTAQSDLASYYPEGYIGFMDADQLGVDLPLLLGDDLSQLHLSPADVRKAKMVTRLHRLHLLS